MTEQKDLIVSIDPDNALAVYSKPNGLDPYLAKIRQEVESFVPDMTTDAGRKAIASIAYKVAKSKTYLDSLGKSLTDEWAKKKKVVDEERRRVRDELDALKDQVRKPLTEWEQAEKERVDRLSSTVAWLDSAKSTQNDDGSAMTAYEIQAVIDSVEAVEVDDSFAEFMAAATSSKSASLDILNARKAEAEKREAEARELEELRRKQEEQRRKDEIAEAEKRAEERARQQAREEAEAAQRAAEAKEQAAKAEAERKEREHKEAAERAAREHQEAIERAEREKVAAIEAERQRIEQEQAEQKAEDEKREKNRAHQKAIHGEIIEDLGAIGITEDQAKAIITAVRKGGVRNMKVVY